MYVVFSRKNHFLCLNLYYISFPFFLSLIRQEVYRRQPGARNSSYAASSNHKQGHPTISVYILDTMSSSFGDGYATRSDEEGFGGIYGGNKEDEEKIIHGKAHEYDTNQGSEVKEKEKARNQRQAA
ncbi:PREDICTED: uncharacterized protein LOC109244985 isoform X2 [Nicotiana attenuata]|uniref:uncharacterized protein LOC109244985 isoform X2 n=1 Tax=Nicotiana attenuata TaxID=49451 RepID=UPI000904FE90|nr:PREDICTED: uncharacterized protein LOC109244985 isoform X2 [Nicotiana attenuata]